MQMSERTFTGANGYRYGFNGKEKIDELHNNSGDAYDFGARLYDSRLGKWMAIDPQAERYTSYSPYHAMYCNPIAVKDNDGEENIVVVGNQGGSPSSDITGWKSLWGLVGSSYRYGENSKHFLTAGLRQAANQKKYHTEENEETTMIVFVGDYTENELNHYEKAAKHLGINVVRTTSADEIKDYINKSGGYVNNKPSPKGRGDDLITDFTYVGHGTNNSLFVGHEEDESELFGKDMSKMAFSNKCNAKLYGCGNGLDIFDYFRDNLVGGNVTGYRTTLEWGVKGLGSFEADPHKYFRYADPRRHITRPILSENKRLRTESGKAGKQGKVNGNQTKGTKGTKGSNKKGSHMNVRHL